MTSTSRIMHLVLKAAAWELPGSRRLTHLPHLCRKELAESKPLLIAGVAVFWCMPALWTIVWLLAYPYFGTGGFFTTLMAIAGWFYAIVVGAHTVCRDWGRPEGLFLQARPVPPASIVVAKLIAGLAILGVIALPAALDGFFSAERNLWRGSDWDRSNIPAVFTLWAMVVGYFLAFASAFVTRQTLSSILVPVLVLVLWLAAPLLSNRLAVLHPSAVGGEWTRPLMTGRFLMTDPEIGRGVLMAAPAPPVQWSHTGTPFLVTVSLVLVVAITASFWACTRERVVRLGYRTLAWTIAVMVLGLFGAAMREVGNSLEVTDQAGLLFSSVRQHGSTEFVRRGDRCYALGDGPWSGDHQWLAAFEVGPDGRLQGFREDRIWSLVWPDGELPEFLDPTGNPAPQDVLAPIDALHTPGAQTPCSLFVRSLSSFHIDESGDLVITGFWRRRPLEEIHRVTIRWPSPQEGPARVIGHQVLVFPKINLLPGDACLMEYGLTENHAYLRYQYQAGVTGVPGFYPNYYEATQNDRIYRYDFALDSTSFCRLQPVAEYVTGSIEFKAILDSPKRAEESMSRWPLVGRDSTRRRPFSSSRPSSYDRWRDTSEGLKRDLPMIVLDKPPFIPGDTWEQAPERNRFFQSGLALADKRLMCFSDKTGFFVFNDPVPSLRALVGKCPASPLAMFWRTGMDVSPNLAKQFDLIALSGSRVAELDNNTLSLYDLADPTRPRRIGFLSRFVPFPRVETQVLDFGRHLVLCEGGLLTVLANPPAKR